jgi:hypothetical protein
VVLVDVFLTLVALQPVHQVGRGSMVAVKVVMLVVPVVPALAVAVVQHLLSHSPIKIRC